MGLAEEIRLRIDLGMLPGARPEKMYSRYGDGNPCSACGAAVHPAQIRYMFEVSDTTYHFHIGCLGLWDAELRRRGPRPVETLSQRLQAALRHSAPAGYCLPCLAAKLMAPMKELRDAAQVLVVQSDFRIREGACLACDRWGRVLWFIPPRRSESTSDERERMTTFRCSQGHEVQIKSRRVSLIDVPIMCVECDNEMHLA
jgi:hypothetical protein